MADASVTRDDVAHIVEQAEALLLAGDARGAADALTHANREASDVRLEQALVHIRHQGCAACPAPSPRAPRPAIEPGIPGPTLFEIEAADLSVEAVREGFADSGCVLVRGLVAPERVDRLVAGIDASFAAFDASELGEPYDESWYVPFPMPDVISPESAGQAVITPAGAPGANPLPAVAHRRLVRKAGGVWTVDSPRMLFEFFELVDDLGIGDLITEFFGERPFLSANKCTLRRVLPENMAGGWHQDGAFLGQEVAAFNAWFALTRCGRDAPGLDIVPARFDELLSAGGEHAYFKWSLSDEAVAAGAGPASVVRPEFEAGDALLFDHRLVHRTANSASMAHDRHAIESWWFAPSAFPPSQLPLFY